MAGDDVEIEVVYAARLQQVTVPLRVAAGTTAGAAIVLSGLLGRFEEIDAEHCEVGIHGRRVSRDVVLRAGDRVEIYRTLLAEPKQARRLRAQRGA